MQGRPKSVSISASSVRCIADGEPIADYQPEEATDMRYALLIYTQATEPSPEEYESTMAAYNAFTKEAVDAGVMRGGEALEDAKTATTVRVRDGQTLVTDGPFAETKEE